jgi:membrane-bound serine protease (ClpP class)
LVLLLLSAGGLTGALARGAATGRGAAGAWAAADPATAAATAAQPATNPATTRPGARGTDEGWFAPPVRTSPLPVLPDKVTSAFVIPVREEISEKTYYAIKRKLVRCLASGAQLIVLDMDTPGGGLFDGLNIARTLRTDAKDTRVVCYVRPETISAGTMIALACDQIVMTPVGKMGDCGVVYLLGRPSGLPPDKIETYVRAEFRQSAEMHGYSDALAQKMVDPNKEAWLIRDKKTRELQYVLADEYSGRVSIAPGLSKVPSNPDADWDLLRIVVPAGNLLTLTTPEAVNYGFCAAVVDSPRKDPLAGLAEHYNVSGGFEVLEDTFSEELLELFTGMAMTSLLLAGGIVFGYIEFHTPGFGLFGSLSVICLALLLGSRFLTGMAQWWEITLFVLGLVLLGVEVFITPGFGVTGTLGIIFCLVGLLAILVPNAPNKLPWPSSDLDWSVFKRGAAAMAIGLLAAAAAMMMLAKYLPKVPVANWLILKPAAASPAAMSEAALEPVRSIAVGQIGVVAGICRPAGQVRFGEAIVDAVTEGEYIPAGTKVRVIRNESNRVVVMRA